MRIDARVQNRAERVNGAGQRAKPHRAGSLLHWACKGGAFRTAPHSRVKRTPTPRALDDLGVGDTDPVGNLLKYVLTYMSCCHPVQAFKTGYKTSNGKDEYIRCPDLSYSGYLPVTKLKKPVDLRVAPNSMIPGEGRCLTDPLEQPCGMCVGCRLDHARDWKVRCCLELQYSKEAIFLTLTYDDRHLPFSLGSGESCLHYPDVQRFLKRLRKEIGPFRYFGCGEYGDVKKTGRPHYHLILFTDRVRKSEMVGVRKWTSDVIGRVWPYGQHVIEDVSPGNIAYVCGYVEKKQADPDWFDYPVKPFTFMSTKPALGSMYLIEHYDSVKATKKVYGLFDDSGKAKSAPLPRHFKRMLEDFDWYKEWKEKTLMLSQNRIEVEKAVYGCSDRSRIGSAKESGLYSRLEKVRRKTL